MDGLCHTMVAKFQPIQCVMSPRMEWKPYIFKLGTDQQPLLALLHEHQANSTQASAWICLWLLVLLAYEHFITFWKTQAHQNADVLNSPSARNSNLVTNPPELVVLMEHLDGFQITAYHIRVWTRRVSILSKVLQHIERRWPSPCDTTLVLYSSKRSELSV